MKVLKLMESDFIWLSKTPRRDQSKDWNSGGIRALNIARFRYKEEKRRVNQRRMREEERREERELFVCLSIYVICRMMKNGKEGKQEFIAFNTHLDRWGELARREQSSLVCLPLLFFSFLSFPFLSLPLLPLFFSSAFFLFIFLFSYLLSSCRSSRLLKSGRQDIRMRSSFCLETSTRLQVWPLTSPSLSPSSLFLLLSPSLSSVVIYRYTLSSLPNFPVGQVAHTTLTSHMADSWDWCKDHSNTCITNNFSASFHGTHPPSPLSSSSYFFSCL